ncbi:hypothetical protein TBLA_0E03200 [Henningerozyma blattae CBS 6284]|uniref:Uncharacterized protein n=1 Tax=Henningerozyma blattae (strain ATCC 34711 / CBS 6284 / DSM 70876 / NBRC 10599 / NRRL Y-10934 / UCD 77-7) TaxID=1071380 RepID=I2H4S2_HENB6|nr:hypothetical protein TBLA_0E03200 [Tetrapisispora blattae CBS 6284]CCH61374.1 hypothetical protein TBLA_0E03200 [Tetrapisispora blattae CBS 6284]
MSFQIPVTEILLQEPELYYSTPGGKLLSGPHYIGDKLYHVVIDDREYPKEFVNISIIDNKLHRLRLTEKNIKFQLNHQGYDNDSIAKVYDKIFELLYKHEFQVIKTYGSFAFEFEISGKIKLSINDPVEMDEEGDQMEGLFNVIDCDANRIAALQHLNNQLIDIIKSKDLVIETLQNMVEDVDSKMIERWIPKNTKNHEHLTPFDYQKWIQNQKKFTKDSQETKSLLESSNKVFNSLSSSDDENKNDEDEESDVDFGKVWTKEDYAKYERKRKRKGEEEDTRSFDEKLTDMAEQAASRKKRSFGRIQPGK